MGTHASWSDRLWTADPGPVQNADVFERKWTAAFIDLRNACKSSFQSTEPEPIRAPQLAASFMGQEVLIIALAVVIALVAVYSLFNLRRK
jgi:hypothetical protein